MRISFVGHASILVETKGITILSDPWWRGPCFGAQWWTYPLPRLDFLERKSIDYIYISHGHHDHFHPGTLRTLDRGTKVLVSNKIDLAGPVRDLGFEVIEIGEEEPFQLSPGVVCRIMPTYGHDTLMAISDGSEVCVNLNDALHSAPKSVQADFVAKLRQLYPKIDYVYCGYGTASHFPNCYVVPGKDRIETAARRQHYFNVQWSNLIEALAPRFGFPFAADVAFFEDDLLWVNEAVHNCERPTATFQNLCPASSVVVADIAPGFVIEDGEVKEDSQRQAVSELMLRTQFADSIARANRYGTVDEAGVTEIIKHLEANLELARPYLEDYLGNYAFLIRLRGSSMGIRITKSGQRIQIERVPDTGADKMNYDVTYTTRLAYLKWSFTMPYGHEILFVGSGGVFQYEDAQKASLNLHRELMLLLRKQEHKLSPRAPAKNKWVRSAKEAVKKLIGRRNEDLYDLRVWTVFSNDESMRG